MLQKGEKKDVIVTFMPRELVQYNETSGAQKISKVTSNENGGKFSPESDVVLIIIAF